MRDEWYVARRGQGENARYGPVPLGQMRQLLDEGRVKGGDLVLARGDVRLAAGRPVRRALAPPRGPRGDGPDDDRPYRRYPPPRQTSSGWVVALVIGGVAVAVCFLACAGFGFVGYMNARSRRRRRRRRIPAGHGSTARNGACRGGSPR